MANSKTIIKIFSVEENYLAFVLRGHNDLIHDICWNYDDRFLVTASADGSCRVWNLDAEGISHQEKLNY